MTETTKPTASEDLARIIESAQRLGIELDEEEALQWLTSVAAQQTGSDIVIDNTTGVFGYRVSMLDFSPAELQRFREIGHLIEIKPRPNLVETALALSGSAAQSKIQTFPGDCDFYERVNIKADTKEQACRILSDLMKDKAFSTERGPNYQFVSMKYGSYPFDAVKHGKPRKGHLPIEWRIEEVRAGGFDAFKMDGTSVVIKWEDALMDPGWCKLDWVVADPKRGQLSSASLILDVTWEAPDGSITPLDGYLDPYFQEVYLEANSLPLFSKLAAHVSSDALDTYVENLEHEVAKYLSQKHLNYGKVAKRMYNIFRLTGRYPEAAYLRELFDEPATILYQVWSLLQTLDDAVQPDTSITRDQLLQQSDNLILEVIRVLEGSQETEIVRHLLRLRDDMTRQEVGQGWSGELEASRAQVINVVNNFFYERLTTVPTIKDYISTHQEA